MTIKDVRFDQTFRIPGIDRTFRPALAKEKARGRGQWRIPVRAADAPAEIIYLDADRPAEVVGSAIAAGAA